MNHKRATIHEWLLQKLHITRKPVVKVYNGFGDSDALLVFGHVLKQSPLPQRKFKKDVWSNTAALFRMFMVHPYQHVTVQLDWQGEQLETITDNDGFFRFEWKAAQPPVPGWHKVRVSIKGGKHDGVHSHGKILVPHPTQYAFISDIDDTFLISYSNNLRKRLYVLFTKNARTRRPFEGVVKHYRLLAKAGTHHEAPNPFFYISSSEWNLYDYILEFKNTYDMPEGVYLLNQMKEWQDVLKTGQTKHTGKFMRIARVLKEFPHHQFVLLGDDTQQDPRIYSKIVEAFHSKIICVYLRCVGKDNKPEVKHFINEIRKYGVDVCYFKDSEEAIEHSRHIGIVTE